MATATQQNTVEELDLGGFTDEGDLSGGRDFIRAGTYHISFTTVNLHPTNRKNEYVNAKRFGFQVLAGTDPSQVGKQGEEDFTNPAASHKDGGKFCLQQLTRLAWKTGLVSLADLGKRVSINWADIVGRQCVVVIVEEEFTRNDGTKGKSSKFKPMGYFAVNDQEAAGIPMHLQALELAGYAAPAANGNGAPAAPAAPAATTAAAPAASAPVAPAPAPADPLAGLKL